MNILYATDGSEGAKAGAAFIQHLPLTEEDSIALVTVVQAEEGRAEATPILSAGQEAIGTTPAKIHRYIRHGNAALEIIDAINWLAAEIPTDLIVVGTRGLSGIVRFFLGSVAERVARFAPTPVLIAREVKGPLKQIVVGFDGSRSSRRAINFLNTFPLHPDCEICIASMVTAPEAGGFLPGPLRHEIEAICREERQHAEKGLAEVAKILQSAGRKVVTEIHAAEPASGLLQLAEERQADLMVVGAQGTSEVEQFLLGSVSDKILRNAHCSVLVVRPYLALD
jgi:nucleotide-binding universal stress UspA family protein